MEEEEEGRGRRRSLERTPVEGSRPEETVVVPKKRSTRPLLYVRKRGWKSMRISSESIWFDIVEEIVVVVVTLVAWVGY